MAAFDIEKTIAVIEAGVVEVTPREALRKKVTEAAAKGRPLRIKVGIDPTAPDVHLGHLVPYGKMRQLQDLGHTGVVIIGDYTARIGDPSGKDATRVGLTAEQVNTNADKYMDQLYTVLDRKRTEVRRQTEWFNDFDLARTLVLMQEGTVAQMLAHETFRTRIEKGLPLRLHELCYPLLQGYDSVAINADIEMGDPAQKFNILYGREMMVSRKMEPQIALLVPTLMGTDGVQKMSKSLGNHIGVLMEPEEKYGRAMSIPDSIMVNWYQMVLGQYGAELAASEAAVKANPYEAKKALARAIVARFHGAEAADRAADDFKKKFSEKKLDDADIPEAKISKFDPPSVLNIAATQFGLSKGEVRRLIAQGAVKLGDDKVVDPEMRVTAAAVLKVGKKQFLRLT